MRRIADLLTRLGVRRAEPSGIGQLAQLEFVVRGMVCEGCAEKIIGALKAVPGVQDVRAHPSQKRIQVRYDPVNVQPPQIRAAVTHAGFAAEIP